MTRKLILLANLNIGYFMQWHREKFGEAETPITRMIGRKVLRSIGKWLEEYNSEVDDIRAEYSVKGVNGEILYTGIGNDKTYAITPELIKSLKAAKKAYDESECNAEIGNVDWVKFTEQEKAYFTIDDKEIHEICSVFIAGLPPFKEEENEK